MRALVYRDKLRQESDYPAPRRKEDEALIRVLKAGVCSTDLEITRGYMSFRGVLGHEFVGVVEEASDKDWTGRRVAGEINCPCRICDYCKRGLSNHCMKRTVLGISGRDGAFADYLTLPTKNLHVVPEQIDDISAVFIEPLAAAFRIPEQVQHFTRHDRERVPLGPEARAAVLGDGRLGLLTAQVLALTGCRLTAAGRHREKLDILSGLLAGHEIETIIAEELLKENRGKFDYVVDCTGSPAGLETAVKITRPTGTIVLKSTFATEKASDIDLTPLVVNEINLIGSRCGPFPRAIEALKRGEISVKPLITKIYPLERGVEALEFASRKGVIKVLLDMGGD